MAAALLVWLLFQAADAPPAPLACLVRQYGVEPRWRNDAWWARLPGGSEIIYDDGHIKSAADRLAHPDLEDMFAMAYHTGPWHAPRGQDDDPGRTRVEAFFRGIYGEPGTGIVGVGFLGRRLGVHVKIRPAVMRVQQRLREVLRQRPELRSQILPLGGGFSNRLIAGTHRSSAHAYGIAVDINPRRAAYWRWTNTSPPMPSAARLPDPAIVHAFEAEGFIWGGRWFHFDTMHFEYRPELLDPACTSAR